MNYNNSRNANSNYNDLDTTTSSDILISKRLEYRKYIDEHISNVRKAWEEVKTKCLPVLEEYLGYSAVSIEIIDTNIKMHDRSKFEIEEFEPYRKNFYPISGKEKEDAKREFDKAWEHHYMNNPHHWDYWWAIKSKMPVQFIVEMVCDWQAMGYKFGNNALQFYTSNYDKFKFVEEEETRDILEKLLHALCD